MAKNEKEYLRQVNINSITESNGVRRLSEKSKDFLMFTVDCLYSFGVHNFGDISDSIYEQNQKSIREKKGFVFGKYTYEKKIMWIICENYILTELIFENEL